MSRSNFELYALTLDRGKVKESNLLYQVHLNLIFSSIVKQVIYHAMHPLKAVLLYNYWISFAKFDEFRESERSEATFLSKIRQIPTQI